MDSPSARPFLALLATTVGPLPLLLEHPAATANGRGGGCGRPQQFPIKLRLMLERRNPRIYLSQDAEPEVDRAYGLGLLPT